MTNVIVDESDKPNEEQETVVEIEAPDLEKEEPVKEEKPTGKKDNTLTIVIVLVVLIVCAFMIKNYLDNKNKEK